MANLNELSSAKSRLLQYFLSDQEFVDLVRGKENSPTPDLGLRYTSVFPYPYVDDTVTEQKVFVCFDIDVPRTFNNAIKEVQLSIWVFAHKALMLTPKGVLIDRLASCIDKMLNGSGEFGVSPLELKSVTRAGHFAKDFYGRTLTYTVKDINNWKCGR